MLHLSDSRLNCYSLDDFSKIHKCYVNVLNNECCKKIWRIQTAPHKILPIEFMSFSKNNLENSNLIYNQIFVTKPHRV